MTLFLADGFSISTTNFGITSINAIQIRGSGSGTFQRLGGYALFRGDAS
jgi:hypothetical protein